MSETRDITIEDVTLTIEFNYWPAEAQTHDDPGCDGGLEIETVFAGGVDIAAICSDDLITQIEKILGAK